MSTHAHNYIHGTESGVLAVLSFHATGGNGWQQKEEWLETGQGGQRLKDTQTRFPFCCPGQKCVWTHRSNSWEMSCSKVHVCLYSARLVREDSAFRLNSSGHGAHVCAMSLEVGKPVHGSSEWEQITGVHAWVREKAGRAELASKPALLRSQAAPFSGSTCHQVHCRQWQL